MKAWSNQRQISRPYLIAAPRFGRGIILRHSRIWQHTGRHSQTGASVADAPLLFDEGGRAAHVVCLAPTHRPQFWPFPLPRPSLMALGAVGPVNSLPLCLVAHAILGTWQIDPAITET